MHILGLRNGSPGGNSDILLKAALLAVKGKDSSITVSWLHVPSLIIPRNPPPLDGAMDISLGNNSSQMRRDASSTSPEITIIDDRRAVLDALLSADGVIVSSATYSRQPPGFLKALFDRIGGPFLDAGFASLIAEQTAKGDPAFAGKTAEPDPRLLKPRVVGLIATGGSDTPEQFSMALPSLHLLFFPLHARVVDQFIVPAAMNPGAVLLSDKGVEQQNASRGDTKLMDSIDRAELLGQRLAGELGKPYDEARYLGDREEGACIYCHLSAITLLHDAHNTVMCTTCGARGRLTATSVAVPGDGAAVSDAVTNIRILPVWESDSEWSSHTLKGKIKHAKYIMAEGAKEAPRMAAVQSELTRWREVEFPRVPLPSDAIKQ